MPFTFTNNLQKILDILGFTKVFWLCACVVFISKEFLLENICSNIWWRLALFKNKQKKQQNNNKNLENAFKESNFIAQRSVIAVWLQNVSPLTFRVVVQLGKEQSICALNGWRTEAICSFSKVTFHAVGEVGLNCECWKEWLHWILG